MQNLILCLAGALATNVAADKSDTANTWTKLDKAAIVGRR